MKSRHNSFDMHACFKKNVYEALKKKSSKEYGTYRMGLKKY